MTTSTEVATLETVLDKADPNNMADALRKVELGNMLQSKEYDTGTITATATVTLPEGALLVMSAHVVTSGTAGSVGHYLVGNTTTTPLLPPGGANTAVGLAKPVGLTAVAGGTAVGHITGLTFPNTITRAIITYLAAPATAVTATFAD